MKRLLEAAGLAAALMLASIGADAQAAAKKVSVGKASWYKMGTRTASGERFNPNGLTAAHRSLRFGTRVKVTNLKNGKSVIVRINDRGPFIHNRIIDVSMGAARKIGLVRMGVARVKVEVLR